MLIPDVNILVYACISGMPQHRAARRFWEGALNGDEPVGLMPVVLFGFLRLVTNRKIFNPPLTPEAAIGLIESWRAQPCVQLLVPSPEAFDRALALLRDQGTAANLTTDAQIAALALALEATVVTNDSDFKRFRKLRTQNPL